MSQPSCWPENVRPLTWTLPDVDRTLGAPAIVPMLGAAPLNRSGTVALENAPVEDRRKRPAPARVAGTPAKSATVGELAAIGVGTTAGGPCAEPTWLGPDRVAQFEADDELCANQKPPPAGAGSIKATISEAAPVELQFNTEKVVAGLASVSPVRSCCQPLPGVPWRHTSPVGPDAMTPVPCWQRLSSGPLAAAGEGSGTQVVPLSTE